MSESNVELVRRATGAFTRFDLSALKELCLPEVEFDWSRRLLDPGVIRGYGGLGRFFEETRGIFEEVTFEEHEIVDLGDEVLVDSTAHFRGRHSGAEVAARGANVWTIRDGKIARFCFYQSKDDALRDLAARKTEEAAASPAPER
jgi:ketosteroid isomerase-like protein